jgi:hypothetical protein
MFCAPSNSSCMDAVRTFLRNHDLTVVDLPLHKCRPVIGRAFGGTSYEKSDQLIRVVGDFLEDDDNVARQDVAGFFMGFFAFGILDKGGCAFGIKDKQNGDLQSVVVFREHDVPLKKSWYDTIFGDFCSLVGEVRAYLSMRSDPVGIPSVLRDTAKMKVFEASLSRLRPFGEKLEQLHIRYGPKQRHLYVGCSRRPAGESLLSRMSRAQSSFL